MKLSNKVFYGCLITLSFIAVCQTVEVDNCMERISECTNKLVPSDGNPSATVEALAEAVNNCLVSFSCKKSEDDVARKDMVSFYEARIEASQSNRFKINMAPTSRISLTIFVFTCVLTTLGITNI